MLAPFSEGRHDRRCRPSARLACARFDGLVQALADEGLPVPFVRTGSIEVAFDADAAAALAPTPRRLTRDGIACERLDRCRVARHRAPLVARTAVAGLEIPAHGAVDVPALVSALWRSAASRGARLVQARAHRIRGYGVSRSAWTRARARSRRRTPCSPPAAGPARSTSTASRRCPCSRCAGQLLVASRRLARPAHTLWGPGCYLVPWADGTVLVGATVEHVGFDERATSAGVSQFLHAATALVPALADAAFRRGPRRPAAGHASTTGRSSAPRSASTG